MGIQDTIKALSDSTRRDILAMLKQSRLSAGEIVERFDMTGATISHHLSILKDAGLVRSVREGKNIYYGLNLSVMEELMVWMQNFKESKFETNR